MKTYTKTKVSTEPLLVIEHDEYSTSPREWSNLGYFITQDRNYHSPDKHQELQGIIRETGDRATSQAEHIAMIKKEFKTEKILAIYPIVKYEHGGIVYRLGSASGFDYSNNGFYIITDKTQKEVGVKKKDFEKVIKEELEVFNKWINGECYQFCLYNEQGEVDDSCGGFYSVEDIREYLPKEWKDEDLSVYIK
jgi:hypothetical protein